MTRVILLQEKPLALAGGYCHRPGLEPLEAPDPATRVLLMAGTAGFAHSAYSETPETRTRGHAAHQYPEQYTYSIHLLIQNANLFVVAPKHCEADTWQHDARPEQPELATPESLVAEAHRGDHEASGGQHQAGVEHQAGQCPALRQLFWRNRVGLRIQR